MNMGYHVPIPLDNYLTMHGGSRLAGEPISEIAQIENKTIYRQCFETYCLDYNPNAAEAYKVLPAPLGQVYLDIVKPVIPGGTIQPDDVILTSREEKTRIAAGDNQTIQIGLHQKSNNQAIPGMGAHLVVRTSDGRLIFEKDFPLTDASGNASISMDAMTGMMNGDLLMYQACLAGNTTTPICVNGSFLIWN